MRTKQLIFRIYSINALITAILCNSNWSVDADKFTKILDVIVHLLIADYGECLLVWKLFILILVKYSKGMVIEFHGKTIGSLYCSDFDMIIINITFAQIRYIGIPKPTVAAED